MTFSQLSLRLFAAAALAGCSSQTPTNALPDDSVNSDRATVELAALGLSRAEAIIIGKQTATRAGIRLADYKEPEATRGMSNAWTVTFTHTDPRPVPGYFEVPVDSRTGAARVVRGD